MKITTYYNFGLGCFCIQDYLEKNKKEFQNH